eukprot:CAMPEP_0181230856 /NCGR_PEP_ID=MMETSP1096-20121128/34733_1 /TAXON_ID=156174 ORGANISM="Chrysochromulina ericina, Strain CCMP281" /NCGR_SAMPLE_ID=MMETSP1096 /ASSEMBLY_ACC=CAM_ASM_000453 /LENGTH=59 /DNA_ID=CAMNT_0023324733 /DNA_START=753 /DNA_END=932 /DNA_ORIENTATION=+
MTLKYTHEHPMRAARKCGIVEPSQDPAESHVNWHVINLGECIIVVPPSVHRKSMEIHPV